MTRIVDAPAENSAVQNGVNGDDANGQNGDADGQDGDSNGQNDDTDAVVAVDDVSVVLGETSVLESVSLSVAAGEFVGLVGPNGAGKTTLLRTMRATLSLDSGRVRIDGEDVHALSSRASSRLVASVPQDTSLSFDFTVREAVAMGRTPHVSRFGRLNGDDRAVVDAAMARADVADLADRPVTAVSGGERSRVLLARALAQDAPVLLLDEPTASLDVNHQVRTLDLVADLTDRGHTAIAAIHDLDLAARYCDRLVVLAEGRVLAEGPPETVLSSESLQTAFDADAAVTTDPVTGSPRVTALSAREGRSEPTARGNRSGDAGEAAALDLEVDRVHVVAGGGRAGPLLARLARTDLTVTVGPVAAGDSDGDVAEAFGMETLRVDPLSGVGGRTQERVTALVDAADAIVVGDVALTAGLLPVLRVLERADAPAVCVTDRPLGVRGADEVAVEAFRSLVSAGEETGSDGVLAALLEAGASSPTNPVRE